ncbi:hypothetical protein ANTRET_LOCUS10410 [Anthophora retusa]
MAALGEISHICDNIKKTTTKSIRKLFKFITERNGDRNSRKYLLAFRGFNLMLIQKNTEKKLRGGQVEELVPRINEHVADTNLLWVTNETNISETEEKSEDTIRPFQIHSGSLQTSSRTMSLTNSAVAQNSSRAQELPKFVLNFRNIEEAIRPRNGTDTYPVQNWLQDFKKNTVRMVRSTKIICEEMFNGPGEIIYASQARNHNAGKIKIFTSG